MKYGKRMMAWLCTAVLLAGAFAMALPGHAAGEQLIYRLTASDDALGRGSEFTLSVKIAADGNYRPGALRFYLLYNKACFTLLSAQNQRLDLLTDGMFGFREADAGEIAKFPAGMAAAERANYAVAVVQWAALPAGGSLPAFTGGETEIFRFAFRVNDDAPYNAPGGKIFLSDDYAYGDAPYFEDVPVDLADAGVFVQPLPPSPVGQVVPGGGLTLANGVIYGFDPACTQPGSVTPWADDMLANYLTATNNGVFRVDRGDNEKPENRDAAGTGSRAVLWNEGESRSFGGYTMVVFGDLDGNFLIDLDDWAELRAMLNSKRPAKMAADSPYYLAADVNRDGVVDAGDLALLYRAALGTAAIAQS